MKGLPRSLAHGPASRAEIVKAVIPFAVGLVSSGATGVGFGTTPIAGLPEGNILVVGAVAYAQISKDTVLGAAGTLDAFTGSYSIGSSATADATLATTEIDVIAAQATAAATAGVSPVTRGVGVAQSVIDNTDSSKVLNLNVLLDDASVSADTQHLKVSGTLYLAYIVLGDD